MTTPPSPLAHSAVAAAERKGVELMKEVLNSLFHERGIGMALEWRLS